MLRRSSRVRSSNLRISGQSAARYPQRRIGTDFRIPLAHFQIEQTNILLTRVHVPFDAAALRCRANK
jgi:hypothetical protein